MLTLGQFEIENYKNLEKVELTFDKQFSCFVGKNGAGKTNLLDAIYYLSFSKSHFQNNDPLNILSGKDYFTLKGKFLLQQKEEEIFCGFAKGRKKKLSRNGDDYETLSAHIGLLPLVIITPDDNSLITGGSEERRKFIDMLISQLDQEYLASLMRYNKALKQRNALLKSMMESGKKNPALVEVYDHELATNGTYIYNSRSKFQEPFSELFLDYYRSIANSGEDIGIKYQSDLANTDFKQLLKVNFDRDFLLQRTDAGIHKDDLVLEIHGYPAKKFASQGQQKTLLLALKLAQYELIKKHKGFAPLLLLDDIFDRLDNHRTKQLIALLIDNGFGHTFITDTHEERVRQLFAGRAGDAEYFSVTEGRVKNI